MVMQVIGLNAANPAQENLINIITMYYHTKGEVQSVLNGQAPFDPVTLEILLESLVTFLADIKASDVSLMNAWSNLANNRGDFNLELLFVRQTARNHVLEISDQLLVGYQVPPAPLQMPPIGQQPVDVIAPKVPSLGKEILATVLDVAGGVSIVSGVGSGANLVFGGAKKLAEEGLKKGGEEAAKMIITGFGCAGAGTGGFVGARKVSNKLRN